MSKNINIFLVLYYTDYRFYHRILKNSWILIKKNRDILNTKHFQNSIIYYLLFNCLVFLTSFILVYLSMVFQKIHKIFVLFCCMDLSFIKKFYKTMVLFSKKIYIFEIQNFNKIRSFTIYFFIFLAFLTFFFLFHLFKLVKKLWNFL